MDDGACGDGRLSEQARARLAASEPERLDPPGGGDPGAIARWREAIHAAWVQGDPPPAAEGHTETEIAGVRCLQAGPEGDRPGDGRAADSPTVVYLHGGGYALGSPEVAVPITARLAHHGLHVISVDYRLAPEHPYPAGLHDCLAVFNRLAAGAAPVAIVGDSAGANLAVATALARARGAMSRPGALALLSPHLDHRGATGDGAWLAAAYCGGRAVHDPAVSPLLAELTDLASLPPTLVQVGTADHLLAHSVRLARRMRSCGADVVLDVWDGLWHTWHYHRDLPEADLALAEVAAFLRVRCTRR